MKGFTEATHHGRVAVGIAFEVSLKMCVKDMRKTFRRVDDGGEGDKTSQIILKEKPKTPFIVLPDESRFQSHISKSRFALDIGEFTYKLTSNAKH